MHKKSRYWDWITPKTLKTAKQKFYRSRQILIYYLYYIRIDFLGIMIEKKQSNSDAGCQNNKGQNSMVPKQHNKRIEFN